jgi:hypothetical protein
MSTIELTWADANQRHLASALRNLRADLGEGSGQQPPSPAVERPPARDATLLPAFALDRVCDGFGLSAFERQVLLICAGVELEADLADLLLKISGGRHPTFGLALALLPGAHWSALSPGRPLRRWHLVEVAGPSLTAGELRIDERVLHVLAGVGDLDDGMGGLVQPQPVAESLVTSQAAVARRLADMMQAAPDAVPQLLGRATPAKRAIGADAVAQLGARLAVVDGRSLPGDPQELTRLATLLEREAVLSGRVVCIDADDVDDPVTAAQLVDRMDAPLVVCVREPLELHRRATVGLDVPRANHVEQQLLWRELRGDDAEVAAVAEHFDLDAQSIRTLTRVAAPGELWSRCRALSRPRLGTLAQHIVPEAGWDQIVLPPAQLEALHRIAQQVRHRRTVFESWGMRSGAGQGSGTTALFAGPSGTGKTLAAEVLAGELGFDLYRVDLSAVVSKYIGETEKNLRRVFDSADEGSAVLLFDEADALFGRRTEVKDSHDRFANIEVSYLLQRMERYEGLAILTTNMPEAVDPAFQRRIRFVVSFPFPDVALREQIWAGAFGAQTPLVDFDAARLARLGLTGGSIRNVAVNAAFLAAADGRRVTMGHLVQAARDECVKIDQPWPGGIS